MYAADGWFAMCIPGPSGPRAGNHVPKAMARRSVHAQPTIDAVQQDGNLAHRHRESLVAPVNVTFSHWVLSCLWCLFSNSIIAEICKIHLDSVFLLGMHQHVSIILKAVHLWLVDELGAVANHCLHTFRASGIALTSFEGDGCPKNIPKIRRPQTTHIWLPS